MRALFVIGLIVIAISSAEELHFLTDSEENDVINGGFDSFLGGAGAILDIAQKAIDIFRSSKTTEIKERIAGKGFDYFKGGCTIRKTNGVMINMFGDYINNLLKSIKLPHDQINKVREQMEDVLYTDQSVAFKKYDLIFNSESTNNDNCNTLSFIAAYNSKGNLDVFYSNMNSYFKLAPDVLIMTETRSFVSGIWSDTTDKIIKTPKVLDKEEIRLVCAFFEYLGIEQFAQVLGIQIPKL